MKKILFLITLIPFFAISCSDSDTPDNPGTLDTRLVNTKWKTENTADFETYVYNFISETEVNYCQLKLNGELRVIERRYYELNYPNLFIKHVSGRPIADFLFLSETTFAINDSEYKFTKY
jgi:hypothetical protein